MGHAVNTHGVTFRLRPADDVRVPLSVDAEDEKRGRDTLCRQYLQYLLGSLTGTVIEGDRASPLASQPTGQTPSHAAQGIEARYEAERQPEATRSRQDQCGYLHGLRPRLPQHRSDEGRNGTRRRTSNGPFPQWSAHA
jgi:hypothetical protein